MYDGLATRFQHETDRGKLKGEGFTFVANTQVSESQAEAADSQPNRKVFNWPQQPDGCNCGPFAVAAAVLLYQGIRPSAAAMNIRAGAQVRATVREANGVRHSVVGLLVASEIIMHSATHWEKLPEAMLMDSNDRQLIHNMAANILIMFSSQNA